MAPGFSPASTSPFDAMAAAYDSAFSQRGLGRLFRDAVWRHLDATFVAGDRVLDLGCGTGEDALHLASRGVRVVAIDASAGMMQVARAKIDAAGLGSAIEMRHDTIDAWVADVSTPGDFDGVLANFGVLNCVADLEAAISSVARRVRPGGWIWLTIMGPRVPWEWGWWLVRGRPRRAFRRLHPDGVMWRGLRIRYPSVGRVVAACSPDAEVHRIAALGALLPPPYADAWATQHPRLVGVLARWERRLETVPPLPHLADHFLVGARRRSS